MTLKLGIKVNSQFPWVCEYESFYEIQQAVGDGSPVYVSLLPYPKQFKRPRIRIAVDDDGLFKPLPYNGWGIVGTFCILKCNNLGNLISLTTATFSSG